MNLIKPEMVLLKVLSKFDKELFEVLKVDYDLHWYSNYILNFFNYINVNFLYIALLGNSKILFNFLKYRKPRIIDNEYKLVFSIDYDINIEKEKSHDIINYLNDINKEKARVLKVLEFLIVNIDINKLELPNYKKPSNYDDVPKYLKNKIRKHPNNPFDINKFFLKNNLKKDEIINIISKMTSKTEYDYKDKNEIKIAIYFILIKIVEIFNYYYKSLYNR